MNGLKKSCDRIFATEISHVRLDSLLDYQLVKRNQVYGMHYCRFFLSSDKALRIWFSDYSQLYKSDFMIKSHMMWKAVAVKMLVTSFL